MTIQAEWRLAELIGDPDPFAKVILSSGLRVDVQGDEAEVFAGLKQTLHLESTLFNQGVTCDLKDGGQDCLTCPMYVADRLEEPRAPLCRLGRDQRILEDRCNELSRTRDDPFRELVESVEPYMEIGRLTPEYEELLVAAGF